MDSLINSSSISRRFDPWFSPEYVERNYRRLYAIDDSPETTEDLRYLFHTNALFLLTLAPSHPVCKLSKIISRVKFQGDDGVDRTQSGGKGHKKKGAQYLSPSDVICSILCDDGAVYTVKSGIKGKLLEVNNHLNTCPQLLATHPASNGYLAIIMPNATDAEAMQSSLHDEKTYFRLRGGTQSSFSVGGSVSPL